MGPLSDEKVIRLIATNFVPVALNRQNFVNAKTPAGELFRTLTKQRQQHQGLWLFGPDGKLLAAHHEVKNEKNWTSEVRTALEDGLKAFGPVAARKAERVEPYPWRGTGVKPDGGVEVAVVVRQVILGRTDGFGVYDSIALDAKEWAAFSPTEVKPGFKWTMPGDVGRRFARCLSPASDLSTMPKPSEATEVDFRAAVVSVEDGVARLSYRGHLAALHKHPYQAGKTSGAVADFRGFGTFDVKTNRLLSLTIVFNGKLRPAQPYDKELLPIIGGVEWRRDRPGGK